MIIRQLTEAEAKHIRELLRSAASRRKHQQFVIEGPHLLEVALEKRAAIEYCALTEDARNASDLPQRLEKANVPIRTIPAKLAQRISDTEAPQGIFAVIGISNPSETTGSLVLALDAIQDPGNLGTLLRTAAWFGIRTVLLGEGSADAYNPKVVRATQGAIFSVSVHERLDLPKKLLELKSKGFETLAAILDETAKPLSTVHPRGQLILVLGNEAHGVSAEVVAACDIKVFIPRLGEGESLNVAASGAIALYQLTLEG